MFRILAQRLSIAIAMGLYKILRESICVVLYVMTLQISLGDLVYYTSLILYIDSWNGNFSKCFDCRIVVAACRDWNITIYLVLALTATFGISCAQIIFDNILNCNIPWPQIPEDMSYEAQDLIDK